MFTDDTVKTAEEQLKREKQEMSDVVSTYLVTVAVLNEDFKELEDAQKRLQDAINHKNYSWKKCLEAREDLTKKLESLEKAERELEAAKRYRDSFRNASQKAYEESKKEPRRYKMAKQAQQKRRRNKYNR